MVKRILLACSMALCMHIPAVGAESHSHYLDVQGHWAQNQINQLSLHQVISSDVEVFRPDDPISKAELITMILNAKGIEPTASQQSNFADVSPDDWFAPYAETAYRLGIINGEMINGKRYFHPQDTIQKQELVAIFLQANGDGGRVNQLLWSTTMKTLMQYKDSERIAEWNQRPFVYALHKKLVAPAGKNLLPAKIITRAEAAHFLHNHMLQPKLQYTGWKREESFQYKQVMNVVTTAYNEAGQPSYIGLPLRHGVVAVDPKVIPLGTHLYIEGYGYAVAGDIGSAVKNKHVDVFLPSLQAAVAYGRQKDTKVYILD